jgi:lipopolysaccharide transport system permease protein
MSPMQRIAAHAIPRRSAGHSLELIWLLILKDLRVRYKGSFLGYLWAIANPLATTLVYYIAFQIVLRVNTPHYGVYLVTGLFPWTWASAALLRGAVAYRANESLVRKVQTTRAILPLSEVMQEMLHFLLSCPVILAALVVTSHTFYPQWIVLIPVMATLQLAVIYPIAVILASCNIVARDVEYLVGVVLQMVFFLTPIVYPLESIPVQYRPYFELNPFFWLIKGWRAVFYEGTLDFEEVGRLLAFTLAFGLAAWMVHRRVEPRIGEML